VCQHCAEERRLLGEAKRESELPGLKEPALESIKLLVIVAEGLELLRVRLLLHILDDALHSAAPSEHGGMKGRGGITSVVSGRGAFTSSRRATPTAMALPTDSTRSFLTRCGKLRSIQSTASVPEKQPSPAQKTTEGVSSVS
jgi:hypothetical protein